MGNQYGKNGEVVINESSDLMIFRRRWFNEYNGYKDTVTKEYLELQIDKCFSSSMSKPELISNGNDLYEGSVLLNGQINYLEKLLNEENKQHQLYKQLTVYLGFLLIASYLVAFFYLRFF